MILGPFVKIELVRTTNPDWPFGTRATFESGKTGNGSKLFKTEEDCKKFFARSSRSGKGLVPLSTAKKSMIDEKLVDKKFRSAGADRKRYEQEAVNSGWQRGDSASLNRGVAQNEVRRIK